MCFNAPVIREKTIIKVRRNAGTGTPAGLFAGAVPFYFGIVP